MPPVRAMNRWMDLVEHPTAAAALAKASPSETRRWISTWSPWLNRLPWFARRRCISPPPEPVARIIAEMLRRSLETAPAKLDSLLAATATTDLRVRMGLYLMYNTKCLGLLPQDWYFNYPPDHDRRSMLRVLGVKLFGDPTSPIPPFCGWAKMTVPLPDDLIQQTGATPPYGDLLLSAEEMARVISKVQARRYQVVIHVRGDAVLDAALDGIETALHGGRNVYRHRIDHNDYVRPDQIERFGKVGALPLVRGRPNACLLNSQGNVDQLGEAVHGWVRVARSFIDANPRLPLTWHSDTGQFSRRPMHDLYELVTKRQIDPVDGSICEPPKWLGRGSGQRGGGASG